MSTRSCIPLGALASFLLALACATSTQLTSRWRDPEYQGQPISTVMTIAVAKVEGNRRLFEQELARRFAQHGVRATTSVEVLPGTNLTREQIEAEVKKAGVDAVILTRLKAVDTTTTYTPGSTYVVPEMYYNGYANYYYQTYQTVYEPGTETRSVIVVLENNLYDVGTGKLLWTAVSETIDPQSIEDGVKSVSKAVISDLAREGLIPK